MPNKYKLFSGKKQGKNEINADFPGSAGVKCIKCARCYV
jgi:hypothetical protein